MEARQASPTCKNVSGVKLGGVSASQNAGVFGGKIGEYFYVNWVAEFLEVSGGGPRQEFCKVN